MLRRISERQLREAEIRIAETKRIPSPTVTADGYRNRDGCGGAAAPRHGRIGGILSSTALTLLVLPALYHMFRGEHGRGATY